MGGYYITATVERNTEKSKVQRGRTAINNIRFSAFATLGYSLLGRDGQQEQFTNSLRSTY